MPSAETPYTRLRISWAHLAGLAAIHLALLSLLWDWRLAAVPLGVFVTLCLAAPFFPGLGFFGPVVSHGPRSSGAVALTFDDGPHPETTPRLLALLAHNEVRAAFFVVGQNAEKHPDLVAAIRAGSHELGNHSQTHDPFLMLRSRARLHQEIADCQEVLGKCGVRPLAFRPPVGITNPRLDGVLAGLGMYLATWSCRPWDAGNRHVARISPRVLRRARSGDVIVLHDCPPRATVDQWLAEINQLINGLRAKGLAILPLSTLVGQKVMAPVEDETGTNPVRTFYDGLAATYDEEVSRGGMSRLRLLEERIIRSRLSGLLRPGARVLELGAGSGHYTLLLAAQAAHVVAVDISPEMLCQLKAKAASTGLNNIQTEEGDLCTLDLTGPFDLICAFSVFEYIADLPQLLKKLRPHLSPQGEIFFTTAHRSPLRFFSQLANALRQGLWLHARGVGQTKRALAAADLETVQISTHGLAIWPVGGVILAATARRTSE
ncbi:MAG: polysaccharide deacetylase family protein [bacterium]